MENNTPQRLAYDHALHIARNILAWSSPAINDNAVHQVREILCTMTFYRQTNVSGDTWKKIFDYLAETGYVFPLEELTTDELHELTKQEYHEQQ